MPRFISSIRVVKAGKIWWAWPTMIAVLPASGGSALGIPQQQMKMNIRINHHQHEIVDLVIRKGTSESPFDLSCYLAQFSKSLLTKVEIQLEPCRKRIL